MRIVPTARRGGLKMREIVGNRRRASSSTQLLFLLSLVCLFSSTRAGNNGYNAKYNDDGKQDDFYGDDTYSKNDMDDAYYKEQKQFQNHDDDAFHWDENVGFDNVSVMPLSCINYNNGHMIKFQLFDTENSFQCHFSEISTFVVSVAHFMRAYFNYQALNYGQDFQLPEDAGYLNCVKLTKSTTTNQVIYAKIGCRERETFSSTRLQLHLYTDTQCSQPYSDGESSHKHATKGYLVDGELISSKVSFKPPFYSCTTCEPSEISGTFNKRSSNWQDDYYQEEMNQNNYGQMADNDGGNDDQYYDNTDDGNRRILSSGLAKYAEEFWNEYEEVKQRLLYDNYYNLGDWNMCQRLYRYGLWCDEECRSLDYFRTDQWSGSDVFLLLIMCVFVACMMLLIVAKRLKAQQKARLYGDYMPLPGLPPLGMTIIFVLIMMVIITLAKLRFINETLVFSVVTCILLFIYVLKLTLFERKRPVLLAAPKHDLFDDRLDSHLFA